MGRKSVLDVDISGVESSVALKLRVAAGDGGRARRRDRGGGIETAALGGGGIGTTRQGGRAQSDEGGALLLKTGFDQFSSPMMVAFTNSLIEWPYFYFTMDTTPF